MSTRGGRALNVVVANPSGLSWMPQLAGGLARAGMLRRYCSPLSTTEEELRRYRRLLPRGVRDQLTLRALPPEVGASANKRVAMVADGLVVAAQRAGRAELRGRVLIGRNHWFDARVARLLKHDDDAVIAEAGSGLQTLDRASKLGVAAILDYPITHHRFNIEVMQEELRRVPEYAATVQGAEYAPQQAVQLDAELEAADFVITLGSFHRRSFLDRGIAEERLLTQAFGVDAELFRPGVRAEDGVFRVLFSGQITQRKGISYLLDGFRRAGIPNSELLMIGRAVGSADPWIRMPGVRHIPPVPRYRLPEVYATGDVCVLPSLLEGFGLTGLETMAMGIPTIASTNTFGPDVITDGEDGYVIPIRDSDAVAERLIELHANRDAARRMGEAARATAEKFSWTKYGDGIAAQIGQAVRTAGA